MTDDVDSVKETETVQTAPVTLGTPGTVRP